MSTSTLTGLQSVGTTDETDDEKEPRDSCGCTALMPCFQHYLTTRGRPAIRRQR